MPIEDLELLDPQGWWLKTGPRFPSSGRVSACTSFFFYGASERCRARNLGRGAPRVPATRFWEPNEFHPKLGNGFSLDRTAGPDCFLQILRSPHHRESRSFLIGGFLTPLSWLYLARPLRRSTSFQWRSAINSGLDVWPHPSLCPPNTQPPLYSCLLFWGDCDRLTPGACFPQVCLSVPPPKPASAQPERFLSLCLLTADKPLKRLTRYLGTFGNFELDGFLFPHKTVPTLPALFCALEEKPRRRHRIPRYSRKAGLESETIPTLPPPLRFPLFSSFLSHPLLMPLYWAPRVGCGTTP